MAPRERREQVSMNRTTLYQLKYARAVVAIGRIQVDRMVAAMVREYGAEIVEPARLRAQILADCGLLDLVLAAFEASSTALAQDLTDDILAREQRDIGFQAVSRILVSTRGRVRAYRLHERSPSSHEPMVRYASEVLALMDGNPRTAVDAFGNELDTGALVAALRPALEDYRGKLATVVREQRETQQARAARDVAEQRFRRVLVNVASIVEAYLRLAGDDALADRVRPTRARAAGEVEIDLPAPEQPPEAPKDEPSLPSTRV
jgi:hypothetical protein